MEKIRNMKVKKGEMMVLEDARRWKKTVTHTHIRISSYRIWMWDVFGLFLFVMLFIVIAKLRYYLFNNLFLVYALQAFYAFFTQLSLSVSLSLFLFFCCRICFPIFSLNIMYNSKNQHQLKERETYKSSGLCVWLSYT